MTYPKEAEAKLKQTNKELRAELKHLKKVITEKNKKLKEYENILAKNVEHIKELMGDITVEEAIQMAKRKNRKVKPETKQAVREKFRDLFKDRKNEEN